jgi:hypothetical protein
MEHQSRRRDTLNLSRAIGPASLTGGAGWQEEGSLVHRFGHIVSQATHRKISSGFWNPLVETKIFLVKSAPKIRQRNRANDRTDIASLLKASTWGQMIAVLGQVTTRIWQPTNQARCLAEGRLSSSDCGV